MKSENRTKKRFLSSRSQVLIYPSIFQRIICFASVPESIIKNYNFKKRIVNFEKYTMKLIP